MRRTIVVVAAVVVGLAAGASAARSDRPTLRLADRDPVTLVGSRFVSRERVRVTVTVGDERAEKRVVASRRGTFSVSFPALALDRCNSLFGRAVGSEGSRAAAKLPQPQCPPPL
jgi:hypothetical protein